MDDLWGVQRDEVIEAWRHISPMVEQALEHGTSRVQLHDVFCGAMTGRYQLWVAGETEALAVTEIVQTPKVKLASIFICVGSDRRRWLRHLKTIEAWAKEQGCTRMVNLARPGWERVLRDYKKTHVQLEKEL